MKAENACQNHADPDVRGCLVTPDENYTMDFTDVEPGTYLYWCSACGPEAHRIQRALEAYFNIPGNGEKFDKAIEEVCANEKLVPVA